MTSRERIGQRIRAARRAKGLTLRALGKVVGLSHVFLGEMERGLRALPEGRCAAIATALDLPDIVPTTRNRSPADIAADLWRLRDEADALAHATVAKVVEAQPEAVQRALEEATRAAYLKDMSLEALAYRVIRALSPEVLRVLEERGPQAAYDVVHGEDA
jgi:transcriptional regulator with XRE-family HTH domain